MSKAVIYIDVNDDITSIIDKIIQAPEKIVALVPPKQAGVLHSTINLQLLAKVAADQKKYLVIITGRESLRKLSAVAKIPVAKTLRSKPEIVKLPEFDLTSDDLIEGEQLPVGELAAKSESADVKTEEVITDPTAPIEVEDGKKPKIKVPNFNQFRKKLFIIGGAALVVVSFLVWAIGFAPRATITFDTKSKVVNINQSTQLVEDSTKADFKKHTLHAQIQKIDKKRTLEFAATGSKDIGEPASGTIKLIRNVGGAIAIPAGTGFSSGDCTFVTQATAVLPGRHVPDGQSDPVNGQLTVDVRSTKIGDGCNLGARAYQSSVGGIASAQGSDMSGGSSRTIKVVTQDDLDQARQKIARLGDKEAEKELRNRFESSAIVINESLVVNEGDIISSVTADQEAPEGKAVLEQPVSYQLMAVVRQQLSDYLQFLAIPEDKSKSQKVFESGDGQVQFSDFVLDGNNAQVKIISQAKVGPKLEESEVKKFAKGKSFGDVQSKYEALDGVKSVSVNFSPFWVRSVPKKDSRITVKINLN